MDFLKVIQPTYAKIELAGTVITVMQCPLLNYYKLRVIARQLNSSPVDALDAVFEYIQVASGFSNMSKVGVEELAPALDRLLILNDSIELLPWQAVVREREDVKSTADYDNRELTIIIDMLARTYSWSQDIILKLLPEAAACYVQEIILKQWEDREFVWKTSEVAYGKDGLLPFPKPAWYWDVIGPSMEEAKTMVPSSFLPDGHIIDLTKGKGANGAKES